MQPSFCDLFKGVAIFSEYVASKGTMNYEKTIRKLQEVNGLCINEVLFRNLPGETKESKQQKIIFNQDSRFCVRYSNLAPPDYKSIFFFLFGL
jgi:hypothetical protein